MCLSASARSFKCNTILSNTHVRLMRTRACLQACVHHLRASGSTSLIGLWGRSMGAVTALLYSQRDPSIAGVVLDSPFARLTDLMMEIVAEQKLPIPRAFTKVGMC